ncbi:MAG: VOC family protein [Bacteroidia bacterium]|jgi:predicted enzyme related to lactoylglutathione lyase|nr:VOC family protein [Bacteroidia bacterium]
MKRVIGLGGVLFTSPNPEALRKWYQQYLGIDSETWGAQFSVVSLLENNPNAYQVWSPFNQQTQYFNTAQQSFMLNLVVYDAKALYRQLQSEGITLIGELQESEFGIFFWCLDVDGNKVELWQPPKEAAQ